MLKLPYNVTDKRIKYVQINMQISEKKRSLNSLQGSARRQKVMKLDNRGWTTVPVLADEYYSDVKKLAVYVAEISNRKCTSEIIRILSDVLPLGQLQHLKRVRSKFTHGIPRLEVIIKPCLELHQASVKTADLLPENTAVGGLSSIAHVYMVAKNPPLTRKQYSECMKLWPTQFHENKYLASVLNNDFFSLEEQALMERHMKLALHICSETASLVGVVVINPVSNCILAAARDCRDSHPLQHAVMVAIDIVAKRQGGGVWSLQDTGLNLDKHVDEFDSTVEPVPYLCTGYDLYITREPCTMCAMALVHSRIRRVFYYSPVKDGALGSKLKLHIQPGLNHHYEVWRLFDQKENKVSDSD